MTRLIAGIGSVASAGGLDEAGSKPARDCGGM
jgi:hypothetical protein